MAAEYPYPSPAHTHPDRPQPPAGEPASTSVYDAHQASALFDAFLQQSSPVPPSPVPTSLTSQDTATRSSTNAVNPSASAAYQSSSLATALDFNVSTTPQRPTESSQVASSRPSAQSPASGHSESREPHLSDPASNKAPVQLAADQSLTAHGKLRERVYLACVQW